MLPETFTLLYLSFNSEYYIRRKLAPEQDAQYCFSQSLKNAGVFPYLSIRFLEEPNFFQEGLLKNLTAVAKRARLYTQLRELSPMSCYRSTRQTQRGSPLPNLIKVCWLRGLHVGAGSSLTQLKRRAKELELTEPSCAESLQRVTLQMQKKQLKKTGDELTPENRLLKVAELPSAGRDPAAFPNFVVTDRANISLSQCSPCLFC